MKGKELLYLLGIKPKPKTYGSVVERHEVGRFGQVEVACWQHPSAYPVVPSPEAVAELGRFLRPATRPSTSARIRATRPFRSHWPWAPRGWFSRSSPTRTSFPSSSGTRL